MPRLNLPTPLHNAPHMIWPVKWIAALYLGLSAGCRGTGAYVDQGTHLEDAYRQLHIGESTEAAKAVVGSPPDNVWRTTVFKVECTSLVWADAQQDRVLILNFAFDHLLAKSLEDRPH